jgi:hypothetical protein
MDFPTSVANKRLATWLNPLAATLTKNRGGGLTFVLNGHTIFGVYGDEEAVLA